MDHISVKAGGDRMSCQEGRESLGDNKSNAPFGFGVRRHVGAGGG